MKRRGATRSLIWAFALAAGMAPAWAQDSVLITMPPAPPSTSVLAVMIGYVDNPSRQNFQLRFTLRPLDRSPNVDLGTVTPYPNNQPGRFIVRTTSEALAASRSALRAVLVISLEGQGSSGTASIVRFGDVVAQWLPEPR